MAVASALTPGVVLANGNRIPTRTGVRAPAMLGRVVKAGRLLVRGRVGCVPWSTLEAAGGGGGGLVWQAVSAIAAAPAMANRRAERVNAARRNGSGIETPLHGDPKTLGAFRKSGGELAPGLYVT